MANFETLKQRLGRRRGFDGNDDRLGDFINDAYLTICARRPTWSWLRQRHQFGTHIPESVDASPTGTASGVATSGAGFTNGRKDVTTLTQTTNTRTGAKILAPDGTIHRILTHDQATTAYLEAPFGGTNSTAIAPGGTPTTYGDSWKIYWDEFPLPYDTAKIESLSISGNGFTTPVSQMSLLQPHMDVLPVNGYESYPTHYSVVRKNPIPPARYPIGLQALQLPAGTGNTYKVLVAGTGATLKYKWCYYNTRTLERGPMSPVAEITAPEPGSDRTAIRVVLPRHDLLYDYGVAIYRTVPKEVAKTTKGHGGPDPDVFYHHSNFGVSGLPILGGEPPPLFAFMEFRASFGTTLSDLRGASRDMDSGTFNNTYLSGVPDAAGIVAGGTAMVSDLCARDEDPDEIGGVDHIRLWPPPDEQYLVDLTYFRTPKELVQGLDIPLVPRAYHGVILDLAEALALNEEENHAAAGARRGQALEMIARMEREDDVDPATHIELGRGSAGPGSIARNGGRWPRTVTGG